MTYFKTFIQLNLDFKLIFHFIKELYPQSTNIFRFSGDIYIIKE